MFQIKLIIGLGNPGKKYDGTRHNIGFETIRLLADAWGAGWSLEKRFNSLVSVPENRGRLLLMQPQTFMNNSGQSVRAALDYYKIEPGEMLVVSDDFSIPLGTLRLRRTGSDGGHNGLASVIEHSGTKDFPRLRIGIGPVLPEMDPSDFVLTGFAKNEKDEVERMKREAAELIDNLLAQGWEQTVSKMPKKAVSDKE